MYTTVIVLLYVFGNPTRCSASNTTKLPVSVTKLLDKLCPSVDICNMNATNAELTLNGWLDDNRISCCTGCSCHPDCEMAQNCCFQEHSGAGLSNDLSTHKDECLHSAIKHPDEPLPISVESYLTVVEEPRDGCIVKDPFIIPPGLELYPSCEDIVGIRTFFPVYSKSTGVIYKNIQCARCYGELKTQSSFPVLICGRRGRFVVKSFSDIFNFFDRIPPGCHIEFRYSNPRLVSTKRCFHHVIDTCEKDRVKKFPELGTVNIELDVIQNLCESSIYSPFPSIAGAYKNAFCYLCSKTIPAPKSMQCEYGTLLRTDSSFSSLINPNIYLSQQLTSRNIYPELCLSAESLEDDAKCHKVYCPTGRIMDNKAQCVFMTEYWISSPLKVYLKLVPVQHKDHRNKLKQVDANKLREIIVKSCPWPKEWSLAGVLVRYDDSICNERTNLFVELVTHNGNPPEFVAQIQESLRNLWVLEIDDQTMVFRQSLCEFNVYDNSTIQKTHPSKTNGLEDKLLECDSILWMPKGMSSDVPAASPGIVIRKLFFCRQIQLTSNEFLLETGGQRLISNLTRRVLYNFEFDLIRGGDGYQARVCKEDTILQPQHNKGVRQGGILVAVVTVLLKSI